MDNQEKMDFNLDNIVNKDSLVKILSHMPLKSLCVIGLENFALFGFILKNDVLQKNCFCMMFDELIGSITSEDRSELSAELIKSPDAANYMIQAFSKTAKRYLTENLKPALDRLNTCPNYIDYKRIIHVVIQEVNRAFHRFLFVSIIYFKNMFKKVPDTVPIAVFINHNFLSFPVGSEDPEIKDLHELCEIQYQKFYENLINYNQKKTRQHIMEAQGANFVRTLKKVASMLYKVYMRNIQLISPVIDKASFDPMKIKAHYIELYYRKQDSRYFSISDPRCFALSNQAKKVDPKNANQSTGYFYDNIPYFQGISDNFKGVPADYMPKLQ